VAPTPLRSHAQTLDTHSRTHQHNNSFAPKRPHPPLSSPPPQERLSDLGRALQTLERRIADLRAELAAAESERDGAAAAAEAARAEEGQGEGAGRAWEGCA
jgi:hypothetical protein